MSSYRFDSFFQLYGVDIENPTPDFNFSHLVTGDRVTTFPFQVARIFQSPRGPTDSQDGLVGIIVPYIVEDDLNAMLSRVSDVPLDSRSYDMKSGSMLTHTADTLVINPFGFVNSVLLACFYNYMNGNEEEAMRMMKYLSQIQPYLGSVRAHSLWTLSPQDLSLPFAEVGNIKNQGELNNPYEHQSLIFPDGRLANKH